MTIKEIAKLSGYGIGTVSRVLNHNPNVSEKAREAIEEVIRTYHFQPNTNARHLKLQANTGIAMSNDRQRHTKYAFCRNHRDYSAGN